MTVAAISPQQLRSLVEDKWQRDKEAPAVGLHITTAWRGPAEVEFDFGKASVVRADTVFQVREALLSAESQNRRIILLTKLQYTDLGQDVVARLARCRLFPIDDWASLCALFRAKELDRSICDQAIATWVRVSRIWLRCCFGQAQPKNPLVTLTPTMNSKRA